MPRLPTAAEFISLYTSRQNRIVERFFRSLKEECVWIKNFASFDEARAAVMHWLAWYNESRSVIVARDDSGSDSLATNGGT